MIQLAVGRLKKGGRIVIDTILIETMYQALSAVNELNLAEVDVTQVTIAKARKVKFIQGRASFVNSTTLLPHNSQLRKSGIIKNVAA